MDDDSTEKIAKELFEIASQQRLGILFYLQEEKSTVSKLAKKLDATVPEVFRNVDRLVKAGLIEKDPDGNYGLTVHGRTICTNIPSLFFVSEFKKYFSNHDLGKIPEKFIHRIGELSSAEHIKGVVRVLEKWKKIHQNAKEYIFNILAEVPYSKDIIEVVEQKAKSEIKIQSIFSDDAVIPDERKELFDKLQFKKFIDKGIIERKMRDETKTILLLNEKEACIMFPTKNGDADMSELLYSDDAKFHDWCKDYFRYCWETSSIFQERKLR